MSARLPAILADIETLVRCESPSAVPDAVNKSADLVAGVGQQRLGTAPELITLDGCPHLRWRFGDGQARVLVLAHHDTVWPLGSLETHPFAVDGGVLRGPGCFDMKAGLVLALHSLAVLGAPDGVTLLVTGDEELGSPSSRELIEAEAAGCRAALVLEAAADGGALKTARKGTSLYRGRAGGARGTRAGARGQRDRRARAPDPGGGRTVRRLPGHHRHADGAVRRNGDEHRARRRRVLGGRADVVRRRAGARAGGDELAAARRARRGA